MYMELLLRQLEQKKGTDPSVPQKEDRRICPLFLLLYISLIALFPWQATLWAEEVVVSGLKFEVESIVPVDAENIKLTIEGSSLIIPKQRLEDHLLEYFLTDQDYSSKIDVKKLESFVLESLRAKLVTRAQLAILALFSASKWKAKHFEIFFETLPAEIERNVVLDLFRALILEMQSEAEGKAWLAYPIFQVGLEDTDWLRLHATTTVYLLAAEVKALVQKEFSVALGENDLKRTDSMLRMLRDLFGREDALYKKFRLAQSRIVEVKELLENKKVELISPWIQGIKSDPELFNLLGAAAFDILQQQAGLYLQAGRADLALRVLTWIDVQKRTPNAHKLVLNLLSALTSEQRAILADPTITETLRSYANNDRAVLEVYQNLLAQQLRSLLAQDKPRESEVYFDELTQLKPQDLDLLDDLRIEQALVYARLGFNGIARKKLKQVSGLIGLFDRVRFAMLGLYSHNAMRLVLIFSILTFGSAWFLVRHRRMESEQEKPKTAGASWDDEARDSPQHVVFSGLGRGRDPRREEYAVCLRVLGVASDSSLKQIKSAYRSKVKEAHPDSQSGVSDTASDRFIQITSAYERALELRTELNISD